MPKVQCPKCAAELRAPAEYKGRQVRCKKCGKAFVLRFSGRNKSTAGKTAARDVAASDSTVLYRLAPGPTTSSSKKKVDRPVRRRGEKTRARVTIDVEEWRALIYQQVVDERFNRNFATFARMALDAFAEQLGYSVRPPR
jgi:hypothetical protein